MKKIIITLVVLCAVALIGYFIKDWYANRLYRNPDFASGNGRIEATEINIAARLAGKVERVNVQEGDMVKDDQVLVVMQTNVLVADLAQAEAKRAQAMAYKESAEAKIAVQEAALKRMYSALDRSKAVVKNNEREFLRYKELLKKGATTQQLADQHQTVFETAKADFEAALASIKETEANLMVAKADLAAAKANIAAAEAEMDRIKADIDDSILRAPLCGRIQYRVAEPGEVLSAGGRALNMIDLTDVYMTFFFDERTAGKVRIGNEVRIVLDVIPDYPIDAVVTYVASTAQFTPKTVETKLERQKLMFRVKAHIDRAFLEEYIDNVKTGLPGVAWVKLNPAAQWPKELQVSEKARQRVEAVRAQLKATRNIKYKDSQTAQMSTPILDPADKRVDEFKKTATKEQQQEIIADVAKKFNETKKAEVEKVTEKAKAANTEKKAQVEKTVKQAVKENSAKQKSVR